MRGLGRGDEGSVEGEPAAEAGEGGVDAGDEGGGVGEVELVLAVDGGEGRGVAPDVAGDGPGRRGTCGAGGAPGGYRRRRRRGGRRRGSRWCWKMRAVRPWVRLSRPTARKPARWWATLAATPRSGSGRRASRRPAVVGDSGGGGPGVGEGGAEGAGLPGVDHALGEVGDAGGVADGVGGVGDDVEAVGVAGWRGRLRGRRCRGRRFRGRRCRGRRFRGRRCRGRASPRRRAARPGRPARSRSAKHLVPHRLARGPPRPWLVQPPRQYHLRAADAVHQRVVHRVRDERKVRPARGVGLRRRSELPPRHPLAQRDRQRLRGTAATATGRPPAPKARVACSRACVAASSSGSGESDNCTPHPAADSASTAPPSVRTRRSSVPRVVLRRPRAEHRRTQPHLAHQLRQQRERRVARALRHHRKPLRVGPGPLAHTRRQPQHRRSPSARSAGRTRRTR